MDTDTQAQIEEKRIQAYISANHLNMTKDQSGIYYQIIQSNPGLHPTSVDTVQVSYIGQLLNGTTFDTESEVFLPMTGLVSGVQTGLQLIGANGKTPTARIKMIIPSRLGYGNNVVSSNNGTIPRNSPMVFTFDLFGFHD